MSEYLVGSPAFKAGGTGDPCPAGSIPVHLRETRRDATAIVRGMKKLILLLILIALGVAAARKLRAA